MYKYRQGMPTLQYVEIVFSTYIYIVLLHLLFHLLASSVFLVLAAILAHSRFTSIEGTPSPWCSL